MHSREHVKERIVEAFAARGLELFTIQDIAFHMTDWKENLEEMIELYNNIDQIREEQIRKIIIGFLAHVPNHVAAAKKLIGLGPIEDVFGVGVLIEDE